MLFFYRNSVAILFWIPMQKKISVEFAMVREIPAEPTAESIRRKAMVSSLPQSFNVEVHSVYFSLATLSVVNKLNTYAFPVVVRWHTRILVRYMLNFGASSPASSWRYCSCRRHLKLLEPLSTHVQNGNRRTVSINCQNTVSSTCAGLASHLWRIGSAPVNHLMLQKLELISFLRHLTYFWPGTDLTRYYWYLLR